MKKNTLTRCYGGVEAGGSKFVCAIGSGPQDLRHEIRFPTTTPEETLERVIAYFREQCRQQPLSAIGVGSFGPVDARRGSPTFGYITSTPKPGWANTDFAGALERALELPVYFDTDVNAAALGEHTWGVARKLQDFLYLTVGTGIGGGVVANGRLLHGFNHIEPGHIRIPHDRKRDPFPGNCPFHGDCLEGLACGPALEQRWGRRPESLPPEHPAWELEAEYLAHAAVNFLLTLAPQRIIIGGGVMEQRQLFPLLRQKVSRLLNHYLQLPEILEQLDQYIVPPQLGNRAGILGAIALAKKGEKR